MSTARLSYLIRKLRVKTICDVGAAAWPYEHPEATIDTHMTATTDTPVVADLYIVYDAFPEEELVRACQFWLSAGWCRHIIFFHDLDKPSRLALEPLKPIFLWRWRREEAWIMSA